MKDLLNRINESLTIDKFENHFKEGEEVYCFNTDDNKIYKCTVYTPFDKDCMSMTLSTIPDETLWDFSQDEIDGIIAKEGDDITYYSESTHKLCKGKIVKTYDDKIKIQNEHGPIEYVTVYEKK